LMRWTRRYQADRSATYRFRLTLNGGARLYIKPSSASWGAPLTPATLERPFVTATTRNASDPWLVDADSGSYYFTYTMSAGQAYDIRVEYYHTTDAASGPGRIELRQAEPSNVARTSPGAVATDTYAALHRTGLILNGNLTIPANRVGVVGFQERYSLTSTDYARFYYSLNGGMTWTQILEHTPNNPSGGSFIPGQFGTDWIDRSYDIMGTNPDGTFAAEAKITFKFELNTLGNLTSQDEGWLLDNFEFYTRNTTINAAPIAATATISGAAVTSTTAPPYCAAPSVTDSPGDTHTFTILTQPARGTASVQGSQLCYRPPVDWTGTTSFSFRATDVGGLSIVGNASVVIEPYFYSGINVNGPALSIGSQSFRAWAGNGASANATAGSMTTTPDGASGTLATMLQTWMEWNGGSNGMRVGVSGLTASDVGTYTAYVYVVEDTSTPQTYDVYLRDDTFGPRLVNDYYSSGPGQWRKLGPFTVLITSADVSNGYLAFWFRGGDSSTASDINLHKAKVAGIELWRGGDTTDWTSGDLGGFDTRPGSQTGGGNAVTLTAYGRDFETTYDEGQFAWVAGQGDMEVIARVRWVGTAANAWSKAGVMIREREHEGSAMADVVLTRSNNIVYQFRAPGSSVATAGSSAGITETNPHWVRITRVGNVFTGYYSTVSGTPTSGDWIQLGQRTINMSSTYLIGVALTSHNTTTPSTAAFENITIRPFAP
ncbi:MAG: hypothetical protein IT323_16535, partial [Anaerolineae bacterium]|nr:hypothetical protein [Anaerolineae bacterium]